MISRNIIFTVGLLAVAAPHFASAQALKGVKRPANLPPADYKGVQYVDNDGCIFVRAGRLGNVSWIPRIDQTRKHMCSSSYAATFPKAGETPTVKATEPTVVASLDRGKVTYKGDVVKPVAAPDTSLVKIKEASPSAAQKAKQAAAAAAKAESDARLAVQTKAAEKLRQDAIAKKIENDAKKAAELAAAMKAAEEAANADEKQKQQKARKVAEDKEARAVVRAANKKARADALAQKKADAKAVRLARIAKRDADRALAAQQREEAKQALANKKAMAKKATAKTIDVAAAKPVDAKPVKVAKADAKPVKAVSDRAAKKAAADAAKQARAQDLKAKKAAKAKAAAAKAAAFISGYYVDLGTTLSSSRADAVEARLIASGYDVETRAFGESVKVYAGPFRSESNARVAFYQVTNEGFKGAKVIKK